MKRRAATPAEARALASPLRLRILRLCLDRALTNREIAERLARDPGTTLYHVRLLVETGFLAAEDERRGRRGAVERPYRATGKSWTVEVGDEVGAELAMVEAFREELAETAPGDVLTLTRMGSRLREDDIHRFAARIRRLVGDMYAADDPTGEPVGFLVGLHRRAEGAAAARRRRRPTARR